MTNKRETIGWREWVGLPDLGVEWTKAKIDTGARSSSLHAYNMEFFDRDDRRWVRFEIHPWQESAGNTVLTEAPLLETRQVRSSSGQAEERPMIRTTAQFGDVARPIDLTLTRRDAMGFRMLVGREAIRSAFTVDPGRSYLLSKPPVEVLRANRRKTSP